MSELATRFYVDEMGFLWAGPSDGPDGMQYQRFEGVVDNKPVWSWQVASLPMKVEFEETTAGRAWKIIARYLAEAAA